MIIVHLNRNISNEAAQWSMCDGYPGIRYLVVRKHKVKVKLLMNTKIV